ncbi:ABC transporter permease [Patescibacteria group bacterium]|nr:ABC transporter permease [Patescibacteria group bacterium]
MTEKEIKARYKMAILGFVWIFLNPLLQMAVIGVVFQFFVPVKVDNYFLFLFTGLLAWNFFSYTVTKNTPMIVNERMLIQKAKFPREAIILSIVFSNLFHYLIALLLLLLIILVTGKINWWFLVCLPLPLFFLTILTSGLSLLFSALNVRYRDVNFVVQAVMPLWFYATPIVYTLNLIPQKLWVLFYLNPMTAIVEWMRYLLLGIGISDLNRLWWGLILSFILFIVGTIVFYKESKTFDDWV